MFGGSRNSRAEIKLKFELASKRPNVKTEWGEAWPLHAHTRESQHWWMYIHAYSLFHGASVGRPGKKWRMSIFYVNLTNFNIRS